MKWIFTWGVIKMTVRTICEVFWLAISI
jgi:hypothetical protein